MRAGFLYLFLITIYSLPLKSQTQGQVTDGKDNSPLSGVNIYVQRDSVGIAVTDENGYFDVAAIEQLSGKDTIVFSYVGYLSLKHTLEDLRDLSYQVIMHPSIQNLPEVNIKAEKGRVFLNYEPLKDLPMPVISTGALVQDGKIYIISGSEKTPVAGGHLSDKMLVYDMATDSWTESKQKFVRRNGHRAHYYGNKIFVVGGKCLSTNRKLEYTVPQIEIYDLDKDTIYVDWVNPHQAVNPATFVYDDCLYVMGGSVKQRVYSTQVHALDLKSGVWYDTGFIIPEERTDFLKSILVGHVVYFLGGRFTDSMWKVRSLDLRTGKWCDLCDLKEEVYNPGVAADGDLIYIYEEKFLQIYNIKTNAVDAYYFTEGSFASGVFYTDGKLYIVGGRQDDPDSSIEPENVFSVDVSLINSENIE